MKLLDQRTDVSRAFLVKTASRLHDKDLASKLLKIAEECGNDTSCYACEDGMLFPVDSREQTMLSRVYFNGQRGMFTKEAAEEIDRTLSVYEKLYNIDNDFSLAGLRKTASEENHELLPGYNVRGKGGIQRAGREFMEKQAKMSIQDRVEFSSNFMKCASDNGVDIPESIKQYGGGYGCDYERLQSALRLRKIAAKRAGKDGTPYEELAGKLTKVAVDNSSQEELAGLAGFMQKMDQDYGFDSPWYDSRMPNAWQAVFNKTAEEMVANKDEEKTKNPESMTKADVVARFGEDALDEIENENGEIDYAKLKEVIKLFGGSNGGNDNN